MGLNTPIRIGEVMVLPGDLVIAVTIGRCADEDGIGLRGPRSAAGQRRGQQDQQSDTTRGQAMAFHAGPINKANAMLSEAAYQY